MGHLGQEPKGIYANRQERVAGWFRSVTIQRRVSPTGPLCKAHWATNEEVMTRTKNQDAWHERGFAQGIAVACSTLVGSFGEEVSVEEILVGAGLDTRAKMKRLGVDGYDMDILKPVFKTLRERKRSP